MLMVNLAGTTFLMAADIQEVAQAELGEIRPDVLKCTPSRSGHL